MTVQFKKVGDKIDRGISMIIYADPGTGKTTMASTLPPETTMIVNAEANLGPLLGRDHMVFTLKDNLSEIDELIEYLNVTKHPFKYVVLDNISEMEKWMILTLQRIRKKDFAQVKEFGDAAQKMREYLHMFRDLIYKDISVVFNAWETSLFIAEDGDNRVTKAFPKLSRNLAPEVCGIVDCVGHLEMYPKTGDRYVRFEGTDRFIAKSQYLGLDKFEPANLPHIFDKIRSYDYTQRPELADPGLFSAEGRS